MPDRMIREGICTSAVLGSVSERAEMLFLRLIVKACPLGRYHARPDIVKAQALTNRPRIRVTDVASALDELERAGLIVRYTASGPEHEPLLCIPKYGQRFTKQVRSPFPAPPTGPADAPGQRLLFSEGILPDDDPPPEISPTPPLEGRKEIPPNSPPPAGGGFSSPGFQAAWTDWLRHRAEIRKALKPTAALAQLQKLEAMGEARAIAAIRHSLANGWQGIFEPKPTTATNHQHGNNRRSFTHGNDYSGTGF